MKSFAVALLVLATTVSATDDADMSCFLLDGGPAGKPFPSLTQCYKQNQQACCVSAHDETIANEYSNLLSGTCIREYPALEQYYCLGCSPDADDFIYYYNEDSRVKPSSLGPGSYRQYLPFEGTATWRGQPNNASETTTAPTANEDDPGMSTLLNEVPGMIGEIKLCRGFADKLLYKDGAKNTQGEIDAYDGCGMLIGGSGDDSFGVLSRTFFQLDDSEREDGDSAKKGEFLHGASDNGPRFPASPSDMDTFLRKSAEWKFFEQMRPTYFGSDKFEISWYHEGPAEDSSDAATCFGAASGLQVGPLAVALVALVARLLA